MWPLGTRLLRILLGLVFAASWKCCRLLTTVGADHALPNARRYSLEADVWSFGILLEELALGRAPMANMSLTSVIMSTLVRASHASPESLRVWLLLRVVQNAAV